MRRLAAVWLAAVLLCGTVGCASAKDRDAYEALLHVHAVYAEQTRADVSFMMEATFRDASGSKNGVLYYINGNAVYDTQAQLARQQFTATLLGATQNATETYCDGVKVHTEGDEVLEWKTEPEEWFGAFPYHAVPLPSFDGIDRLTVEETGPYGLLYTVVCKTGQKQLIEDVWKLDFYTLAGIRVPDREKEAFGEVTYSFSVVNGELRSLRVTLPLELYEQAGYTPGYSKSEEDNCLHLSLYAQIVFNATGEAVKLPEEWGSGA